jgi:hypothetical protein
MGKEKGITKDHESRHITENYKNIYMVMAAVFVGRNCKNYTLNENHLNQNSRVPTKQHIPNCY